jgi:hypothetical protein
MTLLWLMAVVLITWALTLGGLIVGGTALGFLGGFPAHAIGVFLGGVCGAATAVSVLVRVQLYLMSTVALLSVGRLSVS